MLAALLALVYCCSEEQPPCVAMPGCPQNPAVCCSEETHCQEHVCQGLSWICGTEAPGRFMWLSQQATCDDGDPCTVEDTCARGRCEGSPLSCTAAPANLCLDDKRLKVYGAGSCDRSIGGCAYASREVPCPEGCANGRCSGDPCFGILCEQPPGPCFERRGSCDAATGRCDYAPLAAGTPCTVNDKCVTGATCDGEGSCVGAQAICERPHARGAICVQGECQGFSCEPGWDNCNESWDDGCEVELSRDAAHCGACDNACAGGPHATGGCSGSECMLRCTPPFQDCNGDPADGCEIPVGQANSCSRAGLTPFATSAGVTPGCGTAYCGAGGAGDQSFGTWHCVFCPHCAIFDDGGAWCLEETGIFSLERCSGCCMLDDPVFPDVCGD